LQKIFPAMSLGIFVKSTLMDAPYVDGMQFVSLRARFPWK